MHAESIYVCLKCDSIHAHILAEAHRVRNGEGSLNPQSLIEAVFEVAKLIGVLLIEFPNNVIFYGTQFCINFGLKFRSCFLILLQIAEQICSC